MALTPTLVNPTVSIKGIWVLLPSTYEHTPSVVPSTEVVAAASENIQSESSPVEPEVVCIDEVRLLVSVHPSNVE